jgi:hypothetical protein
VAHACLIIDRNGSRNEQEVSFDGTIREDETAEWSSHGETLPARRGREAVAPAFLRVDLEQELDDAMLGGVFRC